jgi:hypothetical protein
MTILYALDPDSLEICMTDPTPAERAEVEGITRDYSGCPLPTLDGIRTDIAGTRSGVSHLLPKHEGSRRESKPKRSQLA